MRKNKPETDSPSSPTIRKSNYSSATIKRCIDDALANIENDRALTMKLLTDVMAYMARDAQKVELVGTIAAKYVETLQRSNEQLVKISSVLSKDTGEKEELSAGEKEDIYNTLQDG